MFHSKLIFDDSRTADFVFVAEGREIFVHRSVLMEQSGFLRNFLMKDPSCTRINANNAVYEAMQIVLKSLYEPLPPNIFGNHQYNFTIVLSAFEISLHFTIDNIVAVSAPQLMRLIDKHNVIRAVKACLKHPEHPTTKDMLRFCKNYLPPQLNSTAAVTEWEQLQRKHPQLMPDSQHDQSKSPSRGHPNTSTVDSEGPSSPVDDIRRRYMQYYDRYTRRSRSAQRGDIPEDDEHSDARDERSNRHSVDDRGAMRESTRRDHPNSSRVSEATEEVRPTKHPRYPPTPENFRNDIDHIQNKFSAFKSQYGREINEVDHAGKGGVRGGRSASNDAELSRPPTPRQHLPPRKSQKQIQLEDLSAMLDEAKKHYQAELKSFKERKAVLEKEANKEAVEVKEARYARDKSADYVQNVAAQLDKLVKGKQETIQELEENAEYLAETKHFAHSASLACDDLAREVSMLERNLGHLPKDANTAMSLRRSIRQYGVTLRDEKDTAAKQLKQQEHSNEVLKRRIAEERERMHALEQMWDNQQ